MVTCSWAREHINAQARASPDGQMGKRERETPSWRPWTMWPLRPCSLGEHRRVHCVSAQARERARFVFSWDYISLCERFIKMQFLKFSPVSGGSTSEPIRFPPGYTDRLFCSSTSLCDILTSITHVTAFLWSHPKSGTRGGEFFSIFLYIIILLALIMLSVRTSPCCYLCQWGRHSRALTILQ